MGGGDQPCFFNIFKQDMSKIEFEYCILDQHKKCFKMRPIKIILLVIWFWPKFAPLGVERGVGTLPLAGLETLPQLFLCDFYHPRDQLQLLRGEICNSSEIILLTSPLLVIIGYFWPFWANFVAKSEKIGLKYFFKNLKKSHNIKDMLFQLKRIFKKYFRWIQGK